MSGPWAKFVCLCQGLGLNLFASVSQVAPEEVFSDVQCTYHDGHGDGEDAGRRIPASAWSANNVCFFSEMLSNILIRYKIIINKYLHSISKMSRESGLVTVELFKNYK